MRRSSLPCLMAARSRMNSMRKSSGLRVLSKNAASTQKIDANVPISAPPVVRSGSQAAKLSRTPERRTAPRRGLSARAGTPKERFCNTTRAGVSGHDNARGFYDAIMRGWLAPQNLTKPKIQPEMPPCRAEHGIKPSKLYQLKAGNKKTHFSLACQ